jgi:chondroitin 4-sulfotransferase 11
MLDGSRKLIFVHVQKTGGSAIRRALGHRDDLVDHRLAVDLRDLHGRAIWNRNFKFAIVRNPWDRLVSWWSMIEASRDAYQRGVITEINPRFLTPCERPRYRSRGLRVKRFFRYVVANAGTFEEFLRNCNKEIPDPDGPKHIFKNQLDYLTDASGRMIVNYVGRFENLQTEFSSVCDQVGCSPRRLEVVNDSKHEHYSRYYSPELVELVAAAFKRDIEYFGFRFFAR